MNAFLVATAFLTRVPVHVVGTDARDVGRAAGWFPIVGAALGVTGAVIARALTGVPSLPAPLAALILVGLGAWVTGGIHLDGLADTADGFGGGRTRDGVLRIMRDPRIGSYGALTMILILGIKVGAIATLLERGIAGPILVVAPTLSRWTIVVLAAWLPYARVEGGLGQAVTLYHDTRSLLWAATSSAVIGAAAVQWNAFVFAMLAVVTAILVGRAARRRIGGVTGDVFGASVELTEAVVFTSAVLMTGPA